MEGRHIWVRLVLPPPGGSFEESHYCRFVRINLHTISKALLLADVRHSLQFVRAC